MSTITSSTSGQATQTSGIDTIDITDYPDKFVASATFDCHGKTYLAAFPDGCKPIDYNWQTGYKFDSATFKGYQESIESLSEAVYIRAGKRHWRQPYQFKAVDFVLFLGWFVSEALISWASDCNSARITITEEKEENQVQIRSLFERLGFEISESEKNYKLSSVAYGDLLERWCGAESKERKLPDLV